ncbi:MAG: outer membrane lipoprotein-sorting protein [Bacteroidales bacterium]|nr:outer membrane lipoprotein-sorting protein [Bacteroidales bacterium]
MKSISSVLMILTGFINLQAQYPDGKEILMRIDRNMTSENRFYSSSMVIYGRRTTITFKLNTWTAGDKKSFTEYTFPVREQGTKMLKLGDQLWIYSPDADRIIQIAGHMLRQSVMGSDLSYEDLMEDSRLTDRYNAKVTGTEIIDGRKCWIIELTAFVPEVAYQGMKIWVDQERDIPLREEMYAKSGTLLKRSQLSNIVRINERWYPKKLIFKDMLKEGMGTELIIDEIQFNVPIAEHVFSKASLKK